MVRQLDSSLLFSRLATTCKLPEHMAVVVVVGSRRRCAVRARQNAERPLSVGVVGGGAAVRRWGTALDDGVCQQRGVALAVVGVAQRSAGRRCHRDGRCRAEPAKDADDDDYE